MDRPLTLLAYVDILMASKDATPNYGNMVTAHCRSYCRWCRRSVRVNELNASEVNAWLASLLESKLSPHTVDTYRRNLLMVWRAAFEDGHNDSLPWRVKRIKKPRRIIEAYTHDELRRLLHAAAQLRGKHRNGNRRAVFWQALIHAAYSSGLRRSDLLLVRKRDVASDGMCSIVQSKTNSLIRVRFSREALNFAGQLSDANGMLLPWPYRKDALVPRFRMIVRLAGVHRGSLKWIRRAAGSYAERDTPGAGPRLLGHRSPHVFRASYEDQSISGQIPPVPPEI